MDETALAIARLREEAKPGKPPEAGRLAPHDAKPRMAHAAGGSGPRKAGGAAPPPAAKRQKTGGS
jgi:hypothetical protein